MPTSNLKLPTSRRWLVGLFLAALLAVNAAGAPTPCADLLPVGNRSPASLPGLHNLFRLNETLYNGSVPEGDEGFQSLQRLGIKTILSVDWAPPDLDRSKRHGIRCVHLPFGYDGCPAPRAAQIVRAVRDLPGPLYVHCHHGKNRSPAAAAFARIALDGISNEQAVEEMERAGTAKNYTGLYAGVRSYRAPGREQIDRVSAVFPETSPAPTFVQAMVDMQHRTDRLLRSQREGWKVPQDVGALRPAHEALQLRELLTETIRAERAGERPSDFRAWMRAAERDAAALETALEAGDPVRANTLMGQIGATCGACHARYRDRLEARD